MGRDLRLAPPRFVRVRDLASPLSSRPRTTLRKRASMRALVTLFVSLAAVLLFADEVQGLSKREPSRAGSLLKRQEQRSHRPWGRRQQPSLAELIASAGSRSANSTRSAFNESASASRNASVNASVSLPSAASSNSAPTSVLDVAPLNAQEVVTVSNTRAAAASATARARGTRRRPITPPGQCSRLGGAGETCSPLGLSCCADGLRCLGGTCERVCHLATTEGYCASESDCDSSLGYTCNLDDNRCRPPTGATRVSIGETCDQGSGNTLFCIPAHGICVDGTCQSCVRG